MYAIPMRKGYTIKINEDAESIYNRPRYVAKPSLVHTLAKLPTKSDAHRKVFGHVLLILLGLTVAGIEIAINMSAIMITATQVILPAIVQEAYDFKWKL